MHCEAAVPGVPTQHAVPLQVPCAPQQACPGSPHPAQIPALHRPSPAQVFAGEPGFEQQGEPRSPHLMQVPPEKLLNELQRVPGAVHV
jgi:hypothetical protein